VHEQRIIDHVDRMVASGLITAEEAAQLRAAQGTEGFEEAIVAIRARHAQAHTDTAVSHGRMNQEEADGLLERVRSGEHSSELRRQIRESH
jgi:polyhydroxyalkanoate synthesis regulator phasin